MPTLLKQVLDALFMYSLDETLHELCMEGTKDLPALCHSGALATPVNASASTSLLLLKPAGLDCLLYDHKLRPIAERTKMVKD